MRYNQPQVGPAQIDWSNPLTRGLVLAWIPASDGLLRSGSPSRAVGPKGVGCLTSGTSYIYSNSSPAVNLNECSFTALLTPTNTGDASKYAVALGSSVSTTPLFMLGQHATPNEISFRIRDNASAETICAGTSTNWVSGKPSIITGVRSLSAGSQKVYAGGVQAGLSTAIATSTAGTFDRFAIGGLLRSTFALGWVGSTGLVLIHNRALSASEVTALAANPWQVFKAQQQTLTSTAVAGGGATATPTGVDAAASVGTASAAGGSVATASGVGATADVGAITAQGGASAVVSGTTASADVGAAAAFGAAKSSPLGAAASATIGTVTASGGSSAAATGVTTAASTGAADASGGAKTTLSGVTATASTGNASAFAGPEGVDSVPAIASPAGVGAAASVGTCTASAGAKASPVGVVATATIGQVIAAGTIIVGATASPVGISAYGLVGLATARTGALYARAPSGPGYTPQRIDSRSRPAQTGGTRPAAIQRNER